MLRDGIGMRIGLDALGLPRGMNTNGTDVIPRILEHYRGRKVALYGTSAHWVQRAAAALRTRDVEVCDHMDGFQPTANYVAAIARVQPHIVVLGMGMPKQEEVAAAIKARSSSACLIINGGAVLDFLAQRFPRAPAWMRSVGLEWLHRLWLEPQRLWRRYVVGNAVFLAHVAAIKLGFERGRRH